MNYREWLASPLQFRKKPLEDPNAPRYADIYGRAVAGAIDLALVFLLVNWLFQIIAMQLYPLIDQEKLDAAQHAAHVSEALAQLWQTGLVQFWFANALIQFLIIGVYWVGFQAAFGTTPGKWLMGYKIVLRGDHSQTPSQARYVLRFLAYLPSCAPLMLGLFLASFNKEHRALHDRIARTVVLNTRPKGWHVAQVRKLLRRAAKSA